MSGQLQSPVRQSPHFEQVALSQSLGRLQLEESLPCERHTPMEASHT
jgi:hypothetical protein